MSKILSGHFTFVVLDPVASARVSLVSLGVDVELVSGRGHELGIGLRLSGQRGQHLRVRGVAVADQNEVLFRLHVQVLDLQSDDLALAGDDLVKALEAAGVVLRVVRAGDHLRGRGGHQVTSARLSLGSPGCPEALLLHGRVGFELDDHEVGG